MLSVWAVDPDWVRRGQLEPLECAAVVKDADVGTFLVKVSASDDLARRVTAGWRLIVSDDGVNLSGYVTSISADVGADTLEFGGLSDLVMLEDRIVFPNPAKMIDLTTPYYKVTAAAETAIRTMVNAQAGPAALAIRQTANLTLPASQGRGTSVKISERYVNLLEAARKYARLGGVTFDVRQTAATPQLVFRVPQDRSRQVRFSLGDGMTGGTYTLSAATATVAVVGGQGEKEERTIGVWTRPMQWGRRVEKFVDYRSAEDADAMADSAENALVEGQAGASSSFEVAEVPGLVLGVDFQLGDTVSVEFGAATVSEPVRSAEINWDGHGRTVKLKLGDHDSADDQEPAWVKQIKKLDKRMRGLETV